MFYCVLKARNKGGAATLYRAGSHHHHHHHHFILVYLLNEKVSVQYIDNK